MDAVESVTTKPPAKARIDTLPGATVQLTDVQVYVDPTDGAIIISPRDAARIMGVKLRTIYDWIEKGRVDVRKTAGGRMRVVVSSLMQSAEP